MKVEVMLFSGLENCVPGTKFGEPITVELKEELTVRSVLEKLNIPTSLVSSCLVNGVHKHLGQTLSDGDSVSIFPPVGGG